MRILSDPSVFRIRAFSTAFCPWAIAALVCTFSSGQVQAATDDVIVVEAETATLTAPAVVVFDSLAYRGQSIGTTQNFAGNAEFEVEIPREGNYLIACRVFAPSGASDSFFVGVDDQSSLIYDVAQHRQAAVWQWDLVNIRGASYPNVPNPTRTFHFTEGTHKIRFGGRESGTLLDRFVISSDPKYIPKTVGDYELGSQNYVAVEAELGTLKDPVKALSHPSALGGGAIATSGADDGSATYYVRVPKAGQYYLACRVWAATISNDSFYVRVDGGPSEIYDVAFGKAAAAWQWDYATIRPAGGNGSTPSPVRILSLSAGFHTIVFEGRELDTRLDRFILTTDKEFVPGLIAAGSPEVGNPDPLLFEAESGFLTWPSETIFDPFAYRGAGVGSPVANLGKAEYEFETQVAGKYYILARVSAPNGDSDTCFVAVDEGAEDIFDFPLGAPWHWAAVNGRNTQASPRSFTLTAGKHVLHLRSREPGAYVDRVIVTPDPYYLPYDVLEFSHLPQNPYDKIVIEAELGTLKDPVHAFKEGTAFGGSAIWSLVPYSGHPEGEVTLKVYVPQAGDYIALCRTYAPNALSDSYYYSLDAGPLDIFDANHGSTTTDWGWQRLNGRGGVNGPSGAIPTRHFILTAGWHTLHFHGREPACELDRIVLTTDHAYFPPPIPPLATPSLGE